MNFSIVQIESSGLRFAVHEDDKEVAHAWLYLIRNDLHKRPFGLLEDLYVEETSRGKGLATELLAKVIARAKALSCYKLIATSRHERETVHTLYTNAGFTKWGHEFRIELSVEQS